MKLIAAALGNSEEAFVETRFSNGLNIIYSNENNKGKTILIQSVMYSIGNTPIFPAGLDSRKYYFYTKFDHDSRTLEFLRKRDSILVRENGIVTIFDSITDFKLYFNEEIFRLPRFVKDGRPTMADTALFFQTFFLPQDKRNTSSVINGGQFNKTDFTSMVKVLINPNFSSLDSSELSKMKSHRKVILQQIATLNRRRSFARDNPVVARQVLLSADNAEFQKQSDDLQKLNSDISSVINKRNRENNRLFKFNSLINELNSLNRNIEIGQVKCADCGSDNIVYSNGEFTFDVSNDVVRREVIASIRCQIDNKVAAIQEYSNEISRLQLEIQSRMSMLTPEVTDIIISREAVLNERDNDLKIIDLSNELKTIEDRLAVQESLEKQSTQDVNQKLGDLIDEMRGIYTAIDQVDTSSIEGLFTKSNENFSGSEEQIFYFSKLVAISKHLSLPFQ